MKRIILFIAMVMASMSLSAQRGGNTTDFFIEEDAVVWQHVYPMEGITSVQLVNRLRKAGVLTDIVEQDGFANAFFNTRMKFRECGYREMNIPMLIARSTLSGSVTIQFKDGRYRVTVRNMQFHQRYTDPISQMGEASSVEEFLLRKREPVFSRLFYGPTGHIMQYTLLRLFQPEVEATDDDNW